LSPYVVRLLGVREAASSSGRILARLLSRRVDFYWPFGENQSAMQTGFNKEFP
jgi:hypothetical protein